MPSLATSAGPCTLHWMPGCLASALAAWPTSVGVAWLAGRLAHSRAYSVPATSAVAVANSARAAAASATPTATRASARGSALLLVAV